MEVRDAQLDFPGGPDHYPYRDEVAAYLRSYAAGLDAHVLGAPAAIGL